MRVKKDSPVPDQGSLVFNWDTIARKYFEHFDIQIENYKAGLQKNFKNPLTSWKDPSNYHSTFKYIDTLVYRQILGDVSKKDVKDVNNTLGSRYHFTKSKSQPATMFAWDKTGLSAFWSFGAFYALYGKFVKGYSIVWFIGPFVPTWIYMLYNYQNQPQQELENAYKYIITKRAATAEYQNNKSKIDASLGKFPKQRDELKKHLEEKNITLYEFEAELYDRVSRGSLS